MAKSKTHKSKSKTNHVDDDEPQVKPRKKRPADDEPEDVDVDVEEADEEATEVDVDEPDAEATEVDADEPEEAADFDEDEAAAEKDSDEPPDEDEEKSVDEGPKSPPAKLTKLAIFLLLMNWIAAPAFLIAAWYDHSIRTQYIYRTNYNYAQIWGLPLKSEEDAPSISNDTRPTITLNSEQLREAFKSRKGANKSAVTSSIDFQPFEETIEKPVPYRLRPSDMTGDLLRDVFQGQSNPVGTIDEEIVGVQKTIEGDIAKEAGEVVESVKKKTDAEKRDIIRKVLFPICWDWRAADKDLDPQALYNSRVWYVDKLNDQIENLKDAKKIDEFLDEAVQRRMYYDILAPISVFRPGELKDVKNYKIEKLANREEVSLDDVKKLMQARLASSIADTYDPDHHLGKYWADEGSNIKRDAAEKRTQVGFILFTLAHTSVPVVDRKLYPKGVERAQIVSGLYEFTNAALYYTRTLKVLEARLVAAIVADRDGVIAKGPAATAGFIPAYDAAVDRNVLDAAQLDRQEKRLVKLKSDRDDLQKTYNQRIEQHKKVMKELVAARGRTEDEVKKLRVLQDQLHAALVDLSDAGDRLYLLHDQIRTIEMRYLEDAARANAKKKGRK